MASLRQIESARRNGSLSKGPVTEEGKQRSSQNAVTHGAWATTIVLANESKEAFAELLAEYEAFWQPQTRLEQDLVHDLVTARWRLNRILTFETARIDYEIDRRREEVNRQVQQIDEPTRASLAFSELAAHGGGLSVMNRYENRLVKTITNTTAALERLKTKSAA